MDFLQLQPCPKVDDSQRKFQKLIFSMYTERLFVSIYFKTIPIRIKIIFFELNYAKINSNKKHREYDKLKSIIEKLIRLV